MNKYAIDLVTTDLIFSFINSEAIRLNLPEVRLEVEETKNEIKNSERLLASNFNPCPYYRLESLQDKLPNISTEEFKLLMRDNFYDQRLMQAILCITDSIFYPAENLGKVSKNQRIKRWIDKLIRIGLPSAEGVAFKSYFDVSDDVFVIKSPQTSGIDLTHELVVGMYINELREKVPNFAYVFGGFNCSKPIVDLGEKEPLAWCNTDKKSVTYIIYENISPVVSLDEYNTTCTFTRWLDKYLQILLSLIIAYDVFLFNHFDLHSRNVLIRKVDPSVTKGNEFFFIPYTLPDGSTVYIKTDGVSTMIDYGYSHIRVGDKDFGIADVRLANFAVYPTTGFPLHDAYKLLMFSANEMLESGNMSCFRRVSDIIKFFNVGQDPEQLVTSTRNTLYALPYDEYTSTLSTIDLVDHIRRVIPEYSEVVFANIPESSSSILSCDIGDNICLSREQTLSVLGVNDPLTIKNVFDFYDVGTKVEKGGNMAELIPRVEQELAYSLAASQLSELVDKIRKSKLYYGNPWGIAGFDPVNILMDANFFEGYKNFVRQVFHVYDLFQQFDTLEKSILFFLKYFKVSGKDDLLLAKNEILRYRQDFEYILGLIKSDYLYIFSGGIAGNPTVVDQLKGKLEDLEILGRMISPNSV